MRSSHISLLRLELSHGRLLLLFPAHCGSPIEELNENHKTQVFIRFLNKHLSKLFFKVHSVIPISFHNVCMFITLEFILHHPRYVH